MTKKGTVAPKRFISRDNKNKGTGSGKSSIQKELSDEQKYSLEYNYFTEEQKLHLGSGQPSKISLKELKLIEYLCRQGRPLTFICDKLNQLRDVNNEPNISYACFITYKTRFPEYFSKIEDWQKEADLEVLSCLYAAAKGTDGRKGGPSTDAQKFILTNRMSNEWKEKRTLEIPAFDGLTDDQIKDILRKAGIDVIDSDEK